MKAVGFTTSLPVSDPRALEDIRLSRPVPRGHDLLVRIHAVSVNPVDTKLRRAGDAPAGEHRVLGFDAAGVVVEVGEAVTLFRPGDEVWYAGASDRPGTNAEFHLVDERIVGPKPRTLDFASAAALPLTTLTAWELLFDRLGIVRECSNEGNGDVILVVGAGGGVGSVLVQLARRLTRLRVVATAGRSGTRQWLLDLGAHHVIDHRRDLVAQLGELGIGQVQYVASLTHTDEHFDAVVEALAPQGRLALIDDPRSIDVRKMKRKCLSLHWEFMFARPVFQTPDMVAQHRILEQAAQLVDAGVLVTTRTEHYGTINAANLLRAHALLESDKARGKIVLEGF